MLLDTLRRWVPITAEAFDNHVVKGAQLSGRALAVVKRLLAGETLDQAESGLSAREWRELMALLEREA